MLINKNHILNYYFNSILFVFYMYRTSYVHHQEDYTVHAASYGMFSMCLCKQSTRLKDLLDTMENTEHCVLCVNRRKAHPLMFAPSVLCSNIAMNLE